MRGDRGAFLLGIKMGDWDYMAIAGMLVTALGVWLTFGIGPALILAGILVTLIGVGGAARR